MSEEDEFEEMTAEEEREDREGDLFDKLTGQPDRYRNEPIDQCIGVGRNTYSIRWILYYAQARHAGIACMYSSSMFANDMITVKEYHEVQDRRTDYLLLWQAQLYLKTKQQKGQKHDRPKQSIAARAV